MGRSRVVRLIVLALLAAPAGPACKKSKSQEERAPPVSVADETESRVVPVLGAVVVRNARAATGAPGDPVIDDHRLSVLAHNQLIDARIFALGPEPGQPKPPTVRVQAVYAVDNVEIEARGAARAVIELHIQVTPSGAASSAWNEDVEAGGEIPYERTDGKTPEDMPVMFRQLLERMLEDLLGTYIARQRLRAAPDDAILKALGTGEGDVAEEAIRQAGLRKLAAAGDRLLALLDHPDESIRDAALGAVLKLRDRRAIDRLGSSRSMRDPREMGKVLEAIAQLGGPDADSYLRFVIDGHEDGAIKDMARAALARMKKREKTQKNAPTED